MPVTQLDIFGLRGFQSKGTLFLAVPSGEPGSGLTVVAGANNAGKSIIVEALRAMQAPGGERSFSERARNIAAGSRVEIALHNDAGFVQKLRTVAGRGSECEWASEGDGTPDEILVVPSRRAFSAQFPKATIQRGNYIQYTSGSGPRSLALDNFAGRLFQIQRNQEAFNSVLARVMTDVPKWFIEESKNGYFLRIECGGSAYHDSEGLGDGIASLFVIIDALYDSKLGDVIAIDEPELSLHPTLQRRLAKLLFEYAKDRQIVVATHSPYFIEPNLLAFGMRVCRVSASIDGTKLHQLSVQTGQQIARLTTDLNNPHTLGLDAREAFFQEEAILLLEGQEDVQLLEKVRSQVGVELGLAPYGWGVGGADKMRVIAQMFKELGFQRVIGILDLNKVNVSNDLQKEFPDYWFKVLPANDIRTKGTRTISATYGLLDEQYAIRPEFLEATRTLLLEASRYLTASNPTKAKC